MCIACRAPDLIDTSTPALLDIATMVSVLSFVEFPLLSPSSNSYINMCQSWRMTFEILGKKLLISDQIIVDSFEIDVRIL